MMLSDFSGDPPDALAAATSIAVSMSNCSAVRKVGSSKFGISSGRRVRDWGQCEDEGAWVFAQGKGEATQVFHGQEGLAKVLGEWLTSEDFQPFGFRGAKHGQGLGHRMGSIISGGYGTGQKPPIRSSELRGYDPISKV